MLAVQKGDVIMKKRLIKKITSAAIAFAFSCGAVSTPSVGIFLFGKTHVANAYGDIFEEDDYGTAIYNSRTGILTLKGNVVKTDVMKYRYDMTPDCPYKDLKKVVCDKGTVFPADCSYLFQSFAAKEMDLSNADTSHVTNMSWMFAGCDSLESLDLRSFDTSNVTDMSWMFDCDAKSFNLSSFDTSNVTNMSCMFIDCEARTLDLSNFDTSNVTDMSGMFCMCFSLASLDIHSFNTSNVTNMHSMFSWCSDLESLDLSNFDTKNVTDMSSMFEECYTKSIDLSSFDTSKVTNMRSMFYQSHIESLDLSNFDTSNVTDMTYMLESSGNLKSSICKVKGNSVTLDGNIGVNVYIQPCKNLAKVVMSGPNGNKTVTNFSSVKQTDGTYKFTYPINATQANEQITLKTYDKNGKRLIVCDNNYGLCNHSQVECTVYGYINEIKHDKMYSDPALAALAALVDGLENYCKAAENYFNGTSYTITGITDSDRADINKNHTTDLSTDEKLSLVLNSATALRIYTDSTNVYFDGSANKATPKTKCGKQYYEINDIPAHQLFKKHTVTIDGTKYSFTPMSYVWRVINNPAASDKLVQVSEAAYLYAKAAYAYLQ